MTSVQDEISREIEAGRRIWTVENPTADSCGQFERDVLIPLLELVRLGQVKIVEERRAPAPGRYRLTYLRIKLPNER